MELGTYGKAKGIRDELTKLYDGKNKLAKGYCKLLIDNIEIPYSKELSIRIYNAIEETIVEKENQFKAL